MPPILLALLVLSCRAEDGGGGGGFQWLGQRSTEEWTILCSELTGSDHHENCEMLADALRRTQDIQSQDVRCEHDEGSATSHLFYGTYQRKVDPKTRRRDFPQDLRRDLRLIVSLGDGQSRRMFGAARAVPYVRPGSAGKPEWLLTNANGVYSLQIAVFYPAPGFTQSRQAAVDLVADLRRQGYEAYYHHGSVRSMVTVGSFDESAVIESEDGTVRLSAEVVALKARDPRFKYNYENGHVMAPTIQGKSYSNLSFLVRIPRTRSLNPPP